MNQIKSYKDLIVWQKSMNLVVIGYQLLKKLPPNENFGLISQVQRSLVSVPSNIAEGYGRNSTKDYIRFL
jgi:four helix bundle protein